jgi:hypothetical protein
MFTMLESESSTLSGTKMMGLAAVETKRTLEQKYKPIWEYKDSEIRQLVKEGLERMEAPLRVRNTNVLHYIAMLSCLKDEHVVYPEDSSNRSLSFGEKRMLARELKYCIGTRPFHLTRGLAPSGIEADRSVITCTWNAREPATFDLVSELHNITAFQISSWLHDFDDLYDIKPSYGIMYRSRETISVRLKRRMAPGSTDYLLIESVYDGIGHFIPVLQRETVKRKLFLGAITKHHAWVKVVFGSNEEQDLALDTKSSDDKKERHSHLKSE